MKDVDGYSISSEGKHPRKSITSAYGSIEVLKFGFCTATLYSLLVQYINDQDLLFQLQKQVWVQKASSGT